MSRLFTLLLLYKNGYIVGKYIGIEKIVENSKESYYDTLQQSSINWYENENNYKFFVEYYLGIILAAYKDFSNRVEYITNKKLTVKERTETIIKSSLGKISKSEIVEMCPDISEGSIERALKELLDEEKILKITGGRYTKYIYNNYSKNFPFIFILCHFNHASSYFKLTILCKYVILYSSTVFLLYPRQCNQLYINHN